MAPDAQDAERTRRFGGYEILELVARGAGTLTYKARQVALGRLVMLTVLPPRSAEKPAHRQRFEREVAVASRLHHENLISAIDAGAVGGVRYFVSEHVDGRTLASALAGSDEPFPIARAVEVARDVGAALAHLETQGLVHRNVRPETVFLLDVGGAKLGGFEQAKEQRPGAAETWIESDARAVLYTAPDLVRGERGIDVRSDIYSLGCVLYRMVAGRPPFAGGNPAVILDRHVNLRPRDPRARRPDCPDAVAEVIDRCLRKSRDHRYPRAAALLQDLENLRAGKPLPPFPADGALWTARPRRRRG